MARFGAAALVARGFAHAVASTSARTALLWAVTACACYAAAAAFFIVSGPVWLRDFPQGAPSMVALQVVFVSLVLTGVRVVRFRKTLLIDELRLRLVANGIVIATSVVAVAAGVELLLALTRPTAAPWGKAADVIGIYAVASAAALAATFVAAVAAARARALGPSRGRAATSCRLSAPLSWTTSRLRRRRFDRWPVPHHPPALACAATAAWSSSR